MSSAPPGRADTATISQFTNFVAFNVFARRFLVFFHALLSCRLRDEVALIEYDEELRCGDLSDDETLPPSESVSPC